MQCCRPSHRALGFTLIELLVVIGIMVLLMAILVPVVSHVRLQAYNTSTQAQMQRILQACESYYHDFNAYPGPIANSGLYGANPSSPVTLTGQNGGLSVGPITSSENLVLGLIGFLNPPAAVGGVPKINNDPTNTNSMAVPPHDVASLNPLRPASYHYIDYIPSELSAGQLVATEGASSLRAKDTLLPEFIDRFPDPMPILYIRANVGTTASPPVNTSDSAQYNYLELSAYGCNVQTTNGPIAALLSATYLNGTPTSLSTLSSNGTLADSIAPPFADWDGTTTTPPNGYLMNPNIAGSPRGKDGFILISAGMDRTYGTSDDTLLTP